MARHRQQKHRVRALPDACGVTVGGGRTIVWRPLNRVCAHVGYVNLLKLVALYDFGVPVYSGGVFIACRWIPRWRENEGGGLVPSRQ